MLVGNAAAIATLVQLFDRGDKMPEDPLELLCQLRSAASSSERTVCNCNKVSEGTLAKPSLRERIRSRRWAR